MGVASLLLDPVHGDVGILQQFFHFRRIAGKDRDPDAGGDEDLAAVYVHGCGHRLPHFVRHRHQARGAVHVLHDQGELVAAEPRDRVDFAQMFPQPGGNLLQDLVARAVAERVVDLLEAVQVEEHEADQRAAATGTRHGQMQPVEEQAAVGQPGQHVVLGELRQPLLGFPALRFLVHRVERKGDVARHLDEKVDQLIVEVVRDRCAQEQRPHHLPAPAQRDVGRRAQAGAEQGRAPGNGAGIERDIVADHRLSAAQRRAGQPSALGNVGVHRDPRGLRCSPERRRPPLPDAPNATASRSSGWRRARSCRTAPRCGTPDRTDSADRRAA